MSLDVTCNWSGEDGSYLGDIIQECKSIPEGDLSQILDEEKCIGLVPSIAGSLSQCSLDIISNHSKAIDSILLFSESSLCEIFIDKFEEYFKTLSGELVQSFEDSKIFKILIKFDKPVTHVKIILKHFGNPDSLWIYSFHVHTVKFERKLSTRSTFSQEILKDIISNKGVKMSEKAEKFQKFLSHCNSENFENPVISTPGGYPPMSLMAMMMNSQLGEKPSHRVLQPPFSTNLSNYNLSPQSCDGKDHSVFNTITDEKESKITNETSGLNLKEFQQIAFADEKEMDQSQLPSDPKMNKFFSKMQDLMLSENASVRNKECVEELIGIIKDSQLKVQHTNFDHIKTNNDIDLSSVNKITESSTVTNLIFDKFEKSIDQKLVEFENRMKKHINVQIERVIHENNKKIDEVLKVLEKININS